MRKTQQGKHESLNNMAIRIIRELGIAGCDLERLKQEAVEFELQVAMTNTNNRTLDDAVVVIYRKIDKKEEARRRLTTNITVKKL